MVDGCWLIKVLLGAEWMNTEEENGNENCSVYKR